MSHKLAGIKVPKENLENIPNLISSYYVNKPDVSEISQKVSFGTSGHRGNSNKISFNVNHIFAITQALCEYRVKNNITGTLFIGKDSHALSTPAQITALQVCIANNVKCSFVRNVKLFILIIRNI